MLNLAQSIDEKYVLAFLFRITAETAGVDIIPSLEWWNISTIKHTQIA
jgi:hypothetical protein